MTRTPVRAWAACGGGRLRLRPPLHLYLPWLVTLLVWLLPDRGLRAELVYDNSRNSRTNYIASTWEMGDEINLAGTARLVTDFLFEYYTGFIPTNREKAAVRFYLNDVPDPRDPTTPRPGTVIYDSGPFDLAAGHKTVSLAGFRVPTPTKFTWTIQFSGVDGGAAEPAGLVVYDPPTVGAVLHGKFYDVIGSYEDYWQHLDGFWSLFMLRDGSPANFGAQVHARPDALALLKTTEPTLALVTVNGVTSLALEFLRDRGRSDLQYGLDASHDLLGWQEVASVSEVIEVLDARTERVRVRDLVALTAEPRRFLRLKAGLDPAQPTPLRLSVLTSGLVSDNFQILLTGMPGRKYLVETSPDLKAWTALVTLMPQYEPVSFTDFGAAGQGRRFYRAREFDPALPEPARLSVQRQGTIANKFTFLLTGKPGRRYAVYGSSDLVIWEFLVFATAQTAPVEVTDYSVHSRSQRFYRTEAVD